MQNGKIPPSPSAATNPWGCRLVAAQNSHQQSNAGFSKRFPSVPESVPIRSRRSSVAELPNLLLMGGLAGRRRFLGIRLENSPPLEKFARSASAYAAYTYRLRWGGREAEGGGLLRLSEIPERA